MIPFVRAIKFEDVDAAAIVFFARFLGYAHEAMEHFFGGLPGGYAHLILGRRVGLPAVKVNMSFHAPAKYGDVLRIENTLYVGQSSRTDLAGTRALEALVSPLGYWVVPVELDRCLHLKTAATFAGLDDGGVPTLLINPDWVDPALFDGTEALCVPENEPFAANVVLAGDRLIMAAGNPATSAALRERGFTVVEVDLSELQKAEAGGTCMSLISD